MNSAEQENARMLASILGVGEEEAAARLDKTILVTSQACPTVENWKREIVELLQLTVRVTSDPSCVYDSELVIGDTAPRGDKPTIYAACGGDWAAVDRSPTKARGNPHPFLSACAAPSVVAAVLYEVINEVGLPYVDLPLRFRFDQLGLSLDALERQRNLDETVLVGAGAVAHGVLRALRHLPVSGTLSIVDPKKVAPGNFNRCTYLHEEDLESTKAEALASRAGEDFDNLVLIPHVGEFREFSRINGPQKIVLVTVDSRRARRSIQSELPGRVVDASTTDIRRVVVYSNKQPSDGACMACIYRHVPEENARENEIARGLGVTLEDVKSGFITAASAASISAKYPAVSAGEITGKAYDSLFKQLCAAQALASPEGKQVLAPFSFVSALAGLLLVVELLRSLDEVANTNYWSVDPWSAPIARVRVNRPRISGCECCGRPEFDAAAAELWGGQ